MDSDRRVREDSSSGDSEKRKSERKEMIKLLTDFKTDVLALTQDLRSEFKSELSSFREEIKKELSQPKGVNFTSRSKTELKQSLNGHRLQLKKFFSQCNKNLNGEDSTLLRDKGLQLKETFKNLYHELVLLSSSNEKESLEEERDEILESIDERLEGIVSYATEQPKENIDEKLLDQVVQLEEQFSRMKIERNMQIRNGILPDSNALTRVTERANLILQEIIANLRGLRSGNGLIDRVQFLIKNVISHSENSRLNFETQTQRNYPRGEYSGHFINRAHDQDQSSVDNVAGYLLRPSDLRRKLPVPKFTGVEDFDTWLSRFDNLVHNDTRLSSSAKLLELIAALDREPKSQVEDVTAGRISDSCYNVARKLLVDYYGGEDRRRRRFRLRFEEIKPLRSLNAADIRTLHAKLAGICDMLEETHEIKALTNSDSEMFNLALSKLGPFVNEFSLWCVDKGHHNCLSSLNEWLSRLVQSTSRVELITGNTQKHSHSKTFTSNDWKQQRKNLQYRSRKSRYSSASSCSSENSSLVGCAGLGRAWSCRACNGKEFHILEACPGFLKLTQVERFGILKDNYGCLRCLKPTHTIKYCRSKNVCETCKMTSHHTLLHSDQLKKHKTSSKKKEKSFIAIQGKSKSTETSETDGTKSQKESESSEELDELIANKSINSPQVAIAVAPVVVSFGNKQKKVNALFDKGCNNTTITTSLMRELNMKPSGPVENRTLNVMTGVKVPILSTPVQFQISAVDQVREFKNHNISAKTKYVIKAHAIDSTCPSLTPLDWSEVLLKESHLKGIQLSEVNMEEVQIVIGTDYAGLLTPLETRTSDVDMSAPTAELTRLGWVLMGKHSSKKINYISSNLGYRATLDEELENLPAMAERFWSVETPNNSKGDWSKEEKLGYDKMVVKYDVQNKKFEASIPWKGEKPNLPMNRSAVILRQRRSLHPSYLKRKGCTLNEIKEIIDDYEVKTYIKKVTSDSLETFYLPFFPVVDRSRATTQVRLVFDAAAKYENTSLNDAICETPNLIQNSLHCLLGFRLRRWAIVGDISQMFNRISLSEKDRPFHRFVMVDDQGKVQDYEFQVQLFGNKAVPNISQKVLLENVTMHGQELSLASNAIKTRTYMDDITDSKDTEQEAIQEIFELKKLLELASMSPRKWLSNSVKVLESVSPEDRSKNIVDLSSDSLIPNGKILGIIWEPNSDSFKISPQIQPCLDETSMWTKRKVLSTLFRQFDPLGLISPYLIRGKVLLQCMFASKLEWDQALSEDLDLRWKNWLKEAEKLLEISIPRYLGLSAERNVQVHCFVDASIDAIACCFYMVTNERTSFQSRLIFSKARVTPMKAVTISRLELASAHLGLTWWLQIFGCLELKKENITFWTDSKNVLYWINNPAKHHKVYIAHRAGEIQEHTKSIQWRYVPTELNPADIPSRGVKAGELKNNTLFYEGPSFLLENENSWPVTKLDYGDENDPVKEKRQFLINSSFHCKMDGNDFLTTDVTVGPLWNGWIRLLRRYSLLLSIKITWMFFKGGKKKESKILWQKFLKNRNWLCTCAKLLIWKRAQRLDYQDELEILKSGNLDDRHHLSKFSPFIDSLGLIRSRSRHEHSGLLPEEVRLPVILPTSARITLLYVQHLHFAMKHPLGTNAMKAEVNKHCLVPGFYKIERKIRRNCVKCVKDKSEPCIPFMAGLPSYRYSDSLRAFSNVGIDFTGSFSIKQKRETRSTRERPKVYVLVFSCLQTRAVHLEVTDGMTTQDVYEAISRFASRRGVPKRIVSDNYSSFKSTDATLCELFKNIDFDQLKQLTGYGYQFSDGIEWIYSPPAGSHFGGCFEIVVKAFKRAFYAIYHRADLTFSEFRTAVAEVESLLNSRPLMESKTDDVPVLTPAHFLVGLVGGHSLCPPLEKKLTIYERFKYLNTTLDHFWKRFMNEFLPELHPRRKWRQEKKELSIGDLVVLIDDQLPRGLWKFVVIQDVSRGQDGRLRQVFVRTSDGSILKRPVSKLLPLDFESLN